MDKNDQLMKSLFISLDPLRLRQLPVKRNKQLMVLDKIVLQFTSHEAYTEKDVNEILMAIYDDYATLRRMLVDYHYMNRAKDGTRYTIVNNHD